jgi:protein LSM14
MIAPSSVVESIRLFNGAEVANLNIVTFSDHIQAPPQQPESQPQSQTSPTSSSSYPRPTEHASQVNANDESSASAQNAQYPTQSTNAWKTHPNAEAPNQGQYNQQQQQASEFGSGPQNGPYDGSNYRGRGSHSQRGRRPYVPRADFDFEQSNAKFDKSQLQQEFRKMSFSNGSETVQAPVVPDPSAEAYYNKGKSFFDNISCESNDKQQANAEASDRRSRNNQERRNNMETFGQTHVPRGRGGHRGRGGNRGGYYRGRGNYSNPNSGNYNNSNSGSYNNSNNDNSNYHSNRSNYRNNHYNNNQNSHYNSSNAYN